MKKQLLARALLSSLFVIATGCSALETITFGKGNVNEYEVDIEKDSARDLEVNLQLGAGEMNISGGASEWITGNIEYSNETMEPVVQYDLDGDKGDIVIKQKNKVNVGFGNMKNGWDLLLTNDVPIDLRVESGAADTNLDLRGLRLRKLKVDAGVGDVEVDLSGDWQESFDVDIDTGVGKTTVILPKSVGVQIKSEEGVGKANFDGFTSSRNNTYVNEAFETADVIITVKVETGVGEVNFQLK
ncbi:toast rack family protein [Bacillus sp. SG-1]|uniref:toast rack family protein n=1 Tax=Bacillus sp. SG-1 TaxID=161544 RepID=UPI0002D8C1FD|nr:toast rack family protein [Bacillus sp. SG-1]